MIVEHIVRISPFQNYIPEDEEVKLILCFFRVLPKLYCELTVMVIFPQVVATLIVAARKLNNTGSAVQTNR